MEGMHNMEVPAGTTGGNGTKKSLNFTTKTNSSTRRVSNSAFGTKLKSLT